MQAWQGQERWAGKIQVSTRPESMTTGNNLYPWASAFQILFNICILVSLNAYVRLHSFVWNNSEPWKLNKYKKRLNFPWWNACYNLRVLYSSQSMILVKFRTDTTPQTVTVTVVPLSRLCCQHVVNEEIMSSTIQTSMRDSLPAKILFTDT